MMDFIRWNHERAMAELLPAHLRLLRRADRLYLLRSAAKKTGAQRDVRRCNRLIDKLRAIPQYAAAQAAFFGKL